MRRLLGWLGMLPLLVGTAGAADALSGLRCEWRASPADVRDPCPEFFWEGPAQSAYRVRVAAGAADLAGDGPLVWDSGRVETWLPVAEYAGPALADGRYYWTVQVWDAAGRALPEPPAQCFRLEVQPLPHHLPTIRTFINFAGDPAFASQWLDLCFRREAKQGRPDIRAMHYGLITTLVLPHPSTGKPLEDKAQALADFCVARGLTPAGILEDLFCHFAEDTFVTLHVGAERAANPLERRLCPGWDPRNDPNGDGRVDDAEFGRLANSKATARVPSQARVPIYFWGPPRDDFVMNVGHPRYLLAHGRFTYFGFGRHPYANVTRLWFPAMRCDLGEPVGPYALLEDADPVGAAAENLLANGGFEQADAQGQPLGWQIAEPVQIDRAVKHSGQSSARITSPGRQINNINKLPVRLKPHTSYTLIAWVKTEGVVGEPGAQVYAHDFAGAGPSAMLTWTGTQDWTEQRLVLRTADDAEGRINFRIYGAAGTAWFDDLRLVEGVAVRHQVYARRYTKGLVLVKPYAGGSFGDETASGHKLPGEYRPLRVDGTLGPPVREVTLCNAEAAVLAK